jgi:hypothetical protein
MKIDVFRKFLHKLISLRLTSCTSYRNFTKVITLTSLIILSRVYGRNHFWHQLSRVRGSVAKITGSGLDDWIYWHFYHNYNQLQQLTINGCLRLAPFLTGLRVPSLPLRRITNEESLATEPMNFLTNAEWLNSRELNWTELNSSFVPWKRTEYRSSTRTFRLLLRLFVATGTWLPNCCLAMDYSVCICCRGNMC